MSKHINRIGSAELYFDKTSVSIWSVCPFLTKNTIVDSTLNWFFMIYLKVCKLQRERKSGKNKSIKPETAHRQQTKWDRWKHNGKNEIDGRKKNFPIQNWNSMKNDRWGEMSVSTKICQLFNCAFILCFRKQLSCHFAVVCMDFTNPFIYQISLKILSNQNFKSKT